MASVPAHPGRFIRIIQRAARWSAPGIVQALLLMYVFINGCAVAIVYPTRSSSTLLSSLASSRRTSGVHPYRFYFVLENGSWRPTNEHDKFEELTSNMRVSTPSAAEGLLFGRSQEWVGLWTPLACTTTTPRAPVIWMPPAGLSPSDTATLNTLLADEALKSGLITSRAEHGAIVSGVPLVTRHFNFAGVLNDLSVFAALSLLVLGRIHRYHVYRADRRIARGLCPRCMYTLRDLTCPHCPECGEPIDAVSIPT